VIPYQQNWAQNVDHSAPTGQRNATFGGLGDISLNGKYLLLEQQTYSPAVAGIFFVGFPSGHYQHLNPRFLEPTISGKFLYLYAGAEFL